LRRHAPETLARRAARLEALAQSLAHLNPEAVLTRGYAIVTMRDGAIVHDAAQIAPSDEVALTLARGRALATITRSDSGTPQG
jgi:exodeoxyribonuclease VII large subunit